jgi:hypothetical protein
MPVGGAEAANCSVVVKLPRWMFLTYPPNGVAKLRFRTRIFEGAVVVVRDDAVHAVHLGV